jgi:simple sugar transport system permease protein
MSKAHTTHEPVILMSKRGELLPAWKSWGIRVIGFLLSLVASGIVIMMVSGLNPAAVFATMLDGAVGTTKRMWVTIRDAMTLLCIAVGLAPAFKMRFWNIGAEGQILVGGIGAAACMIYLGSAGLPNWLLLIIMAAASLVAGAVWGLIPAVFKAQWNTNETLFTLMMNYIAIQLTSFFIPIWEHPAGSNTVGTINSVSKAGWFSPLFGQMYGLNVLIVVLLTVAMFIYLKYSKHGYEIGVVGESENTARYAAINVKKVVVRSMTLSGAICGLAGFLAVAGADHTISTDTSGGRGFIAIIVAWLAKFNTLVMVLIAAMIVFLDKGAIAIASKFQLSNDVSNILTGLILCFILGSEFFINYKLKFGFVHKEEKAK